MRALLLAVLLFAFESEVVLAQGPSALPVSPSTPAASAAISDLADGEVRRIDREARKITLRHGEIKSLDMPPMTMVFRVSDGALLDNLKAGDRVRFAATQVDGTYTVTKIEAVR
jgi:Cu/Ag efflux protein CusF